MRGRAAVCGGADGPDPHWSFTRAARASAIGEYNPLARNDARDRVMAAVSPVGRLLDPDRSET
jgi:hypothetical protein